jgi:hypothetical protein
MSAPAIIRHEVTANLRQMFGRGSAITRIVAIATRLVISACSTSAPALYGGPGGKSILHNDSNYKLAAIEFGEFGSYSDPTLNELSRINRG